MSSFKSRVRVASLGVLLFCAPAVSVWAAPPSGSAYLTDLQFSQVQDATSSGVGEVNMIACIMSAMRPDALVNEPSYVALIDKNKCDSDKRSSSSNAGATDAAQAAASYITATVTATRASNSDPMITKAWLELDEDGGQVQISVRISATAAPSTQNPYGLFRLDYCGQADGTGPCLMRGFLESTANGINYYDSTTGDHEQTTAMNLTATSSGGAGRLQIEDDQGNDAAFAFAYDASLFRRDVDGDDQCFSRDARDAGTGFSVWRYGVYDSQTGARVTRNSGFPIEFSANNKKYNGYLGYHGLSLPPDAASALNNGDTVTKVDYAAGNNPTRTDYTVVKAAGKLTKFTKRSTTLARLDQIRMNVFFGAEGATLFSGATANSQYELYWDEASGKFIVSGKMQCDQNGCQLSSVPNAPQVAASFWSARGGVQGWSQSLGGEVFITLNGVSGTVDSTAVPVTYRTQDLVYPSDLPNGLYCLQNCPTRASLAAYFDSNSNNPSSSPFVSSTFNRWGATPANAVIQYGRDTTAAVLTGGDQTTASVTYTNEDGYQQHPQYGNGVMSGRLFVNKDDALCDANTGPSAGYCDWKVNDTQVYYQWQVGPNPWSQFAAVKDNSGLFVAFDAPLQLSFHVPNEASYGQYRNTNMVLQYGGFGDLWGIPGTCVSANTNAAVACNTPNSRYVPAFVIPYDQTLGVVASTGDDHTQYLVKWLEREIRFARKTGGECAALTLPTSAPLPVSSAVKNPTDSASDAYIGVKPVVTTTPRVVHGEVKY